MDNYNKFIRGNRGNVINQLAAQK